MDVLPSLPAVPSRFIDCLQAFIRSRNLAYATEKTYVHWVLRYIRFHGRKHPRTLSARHVDAFLSHLAVRKHCSPATQKTALNALVFLYRKFLGKSLERSQLCPFAQAATAAGGIQPRGGPGLDRPA